MNARIRVMASAIILAAVALCVCIQAVALNDTGEAGNAYVTEYTYSREFPPRILCGWIAAAVLTPL